MIVPELFMLTRPDLKRIEAVAREAEDGEAAGKAIERFTRQVLPELKSGATA